MYKSEMWVQIDSFAPLKIIHSLLENFFQFFGCSEFMANFCRLVLDDLNSLHALLSNFLIYHIVVWY